MQTSSLVPALAFSAIITATPCSHAHDPSPVWITPSGYQLTGKDALREIEEAANRIAEPDAAPRPVSALPAGTPSQAESFRKFSPAVRTRWDDGFLYIESNGLPGHNMMVGITSWQQQVPLPQPYSGSNAWRIPLHPKPARQPQFIRDRFLRGAIAIAANGIPIFNPQNNRGEISLDIGELDKSGGHCGRADDYHYHTAPLHLRESLGPTLPIAFALDGYPIFGLTEPDGSTPSGLDSCHGHSSDQLGYHYHASEAYPFLQAGFHGEVVERDGQVDPQPRATPLRPALTPLRGAAITAFQQEAGSRFSLTYRTGAQDRTIDYLVLTDGSCQFTFDRNTAAETKSTYQRRAGERREPPGRADGQPPAPRPQRPRREPPEELP